MDDCNKNGKKAAEAMSLSKEGKCAGWEHASYFWISAFLTNTPLQIHMLDAVLSEVPDSACEDGHESQTRLT